MNNKIYQRLENLMERLGFSVSDGSFTKSEIKAYAAAIGLVEEKMEDIIKNIFIDTAGNSGISMYLSMIGEKPAASVSESKALIVSSISDKIRIYSKSYFDAAAGSLGSEGESSYTISRNTMDFFCAGSSREALNNYSKLITYYNPCTVLVDNKRGRAFSAWDSAAFRWFEIDRRNIPFLTLENIK